MRFDRTITLGLVRPLRRLFSNTANSRSGHGARDGRRGVLPILMYHSVSSTAETNVPPYYRLCTTPERFKEQIRWLHAAGWQGVTLSDGMAILEGRRSCTRRPIAITFDDGFRDFLADGFPALAAHGFSATMYLPTGFIGDDRRTFKERECLTWREVAMLHRLGIEFGSHTVTHPVLYQIGWAAIARELAESKAAIEQRLGAAVTAFAYPYAFPQADQAFTARFHEQLQAGGFESCVTTRVGCATLQSSRLCLPRLPTNSSDDEPLFFAKLNGDYDWIQTPQTMVKRLKATRRHRQNTQP